MIHQFRIVVAPDSFKGSISARDASLAIEKGLLEGAPEGIVPEVIRIPIADGGEGTLDALVAPEDTIALTVTGTDGSPVTARYGRLNDTAVIEMASAAGLTLTAPEKRNASTATTFGVGELIRHALDAGFRKILLTVGGSGTNDGGTGMFAALGASFLRADGSSFLPTGATLNEIDRVDLNGLDPRVLQSGFLIATDVTNPLCGETGATRVYAPQKGADNAMLDHMEAGMCRYAAVLKKQTGKNIAGIPGCGAGGGLAAPLLAFCNAEIRSGIRAVLDAVHFEDRIHGATAVITGEGKMDLQSLYGKAISGVADAAKKQKIPVICFVGCLGAEEEQLRSLGISGIHTLAGIAASPEDSMKNADKLLTQLATQYIRTLA